MSGITSLSWPCRIPPVAIYWWQVYPREFSADRCRQCSVGIHLEPKDGKGNGCIDGSQPAPCAALRRRGRQRLRWGYGGSRRGAPGAPRPVPPGGAGSCTPSLHFGTYVPVCGVDFHPDESLPFVEEISPESDPIPSYRGL